MQKKKNKDEASLKKSYKRESALINVFTNILPRKMSFCQLGSLTPHRGHSNNSSRGQHGAHNDRGQAFHRRPIHGEGRGSMHRRITDERRIEQKTFDVSGASVRATFAGGSSRGSFWDADFPVFTRIFFFTTFFVMNAVANIV